MTIRDKDLMDQYAGMAMQSLTSKINMKVIGTETKLLVEASWDIAKMMMDQRDITYAKIKDKATDYLKDE